MQLSRRPWGTHYIVFPIWRTGGYKVPKGPRLSSPVHSSGMVRGRVIPSPVCSFPITWGCCIAFVTHYGPDLKKTTPKSKTIPCLNHLTDRLLARHLLFCSARGGPGMQLLWAPKLLPILQHRPGSTLPPITEQLKPRLPALLEPIMARAQCRLQPFEDRPIH